MEARCDLPQSTRPESHGFTSYCLNDKGSLQNLFVTLDLFLLKKAMDIKLKKYSPLSDIIVS